MTTIHSAQHLPRPVRPYAPSVPRKNSTKSVSSTPVLSSFAIDLIAQFDNYRVNMRESLQREVEENIHKAKVLKEAMKESSDAEYMISAEDQAYPPNNRSSSSLNKNQPRGQAAQYQLLDADSPQANRKSFNGSNHGASKRSTLVDRIFGRKTSVNSHASSIRNHQVTPHPQPNTGHMETGAANLQDLNYLPVDEEEEEEEVRDRSMGVVGAGVGGPGAPAATGTEVKLHPTRSKTFALPKSLRNLKRRIAALRAKGTDLDAERREKEERERANGGSNVSEEKKKFTIIRLLPWKSTKKPATPPQSSISTAPVA